MLMLFALPLLHNICNFILYTILPFVFILGFCITIHEIGHFLFAKFFHIPVEKFSIGFGPPLFRAQIGETDFRIAYFPLGGYVKMAGEEEGEITKKDAKHIDEEKKPAELGFYDAPVHRRILVVFGGPLFNIFSAIFIILFTFLIFGFFVNPYITVQVEEGSYANKAGFMDGDSLIAAQNIPIHNWHDFEELIATNKNKEITITIVRSGIQISKRVIVHPESLGFKSLVPPVLGTVKRDGPAYKAGLKQGDRVVKIDNSDVHTWYEVVDIVRKSKEISLTFEWIHETETKTAEIIPVSFYDPIAQDTIGQIGVFMPLTRKFLPPVKAFTSSIQRTSSIIWLTLKIFYQLITGKISRRAVGGPIAIAKLSAESAQWGFEYLLGLLALISVNLGLINLFPLPALDGGHIVIFTIEAVRGKRFSKNTKMIIQQIGYAIILLLFLFITFNDITR